MNKKEPRILIISNNSFSSTRNNGKTLLSLFESYKSENIAQLYFYNELPDTNIFLNYYRITDNQILRSCFNKTQKVGGIVAPRQEYIAELNNKEVNPFFNFIKSSNGMRLIREYLWGRKSWDTEDLKNWVRDFSPDVIFFCAGDSNFAYDIANKLVIDTNAKLVLYVTDDYILPRKKKSLFWWWRRNLTLKKLKATAKKSDIFYTISPQMKNMYQEILEVNSEIAINISRNLSKNSEGALKNSELTLVYAGGLHFKRYETLIILIKAIERLNREAQLEKKIKLVIYSQSKLSENNIKSLNTESSVFKGPINSAELVQVLRECDVPVHVESFDEKSIESTRLSISTKIPEYLSLKKEILAIGPDNIASMKYLKDYAFCISNVSDLQSRLLEFITNEELRKELAEKSYNKYLESHQEHLEKLKFKNKIDDLL